MKPLSEAPAKALLTEASRTKVIVFRIIKRNGEVKAMPIASHDRKAVHAAVDVHAREGLPYYTDQWHVHAILKLRGDLEVVRKEKVGRDHIDGLEGF